MIDTKAVSYWERFIGFRLDFAALAYDAFRATREGTFTASGRLLALFAFGLLLAVPATVLAIGDDAFGDKWAFGATFGVWPIFLEAPGWWLRREEAARLTAAVTPSPNPGFDATMFGLLCAIGLAAEVIVLYVLVDPPHEISPTWLGVLWGIGLAGALDFARSSVALFLAGADGYPLYR